MEQLSKFDFEIEHRKGGKHTNADFMSRVVRGDIAECKQCHMPLTDCDAFVPDRNDINDTINVDISVLELGDTSDEEEPIHNEQRVQRKKRGRKTNKPKAATAQKEPEHVLTEESIRTAQRGDSDISFIIDLIESEAAKPSWADISSKSTSVKFWLARWKLLSVQNGLLCIKWE
ncbi:MAG: hypothetical protein JAZ03_10460, partial [Candidatus Thiodiazotropha taylori]|nr:hypothetical protein [Candidatus Thiodiazotropha taylori]MCW4334349.1 hypothetical protein [Candidatus Thiodiazotropha endolucinida]